MPTSAVVFPVDQEWLGIGREATPGTAVTPVQTIPVDKMAPDNKPTVLEDKSLIGSMAEDGAAVLGTEIAEFDPSGNVFLDVTGFLLHNVLGDYVATGTNSGTATTLSAAAAAGATTISTVATESINTVLQLGSTGQTENVTVTAVTGSGPYTLTLKQPLLYAHASAASAQPVVAPFTHVFSTLNSAGGQPPTHTLTHYTGITSAYGARQYASWCCEEIAFDLSAEKLFTYTSKGQSWLGQPAAAAPTNSVGDVVPSPSWQFLVGIGGPASGATLIGNVTSGAVTIMRNKLAPQFGANGSQNPIVIARSGISVTGKFTQVAQDDSALLNLLNNTQPQLQLKMSNGLTGSSLRSIQFDIQTGIYETTKQTDKDIIFYDVAWRGARNSTNAGATGGLSPVKVTLTNAIASY